MVTYTCDCMPGCPWRAKVSMLDGRQYIEVYKENGTQVGSGFWLPKGLKIEGRAEDGSLVDMGGSTVDVHEYTVSPDCLGRLQSGGAE